MTGVFCLFSSCIFFSIKENKELYTHIVHTKEKKKQKRTVRVRVWSRLIQRGKEAIHKQKREGCFDMHTKLIFLE